MNKYYTQTKEMLKEVQWRVANGYCMQCGKNIGYSGYCSWMCGADLNYPLIVLGLTENKELQRQYTQQEELSMKEFNKERLSDYYVKRKYEKTPDKFKRKSVCMLCDIEVKSPLRYCSTDHAKLMKSIKFTPEGMKINDRASDEAKELFRQFTE